MLSTTRVARHKATLASSVALPFASAILIPPLRKLEDLLESRLEISSSDKAKNTIYNVLRFLFPVYPCRHQVVSNEVSSAERAKHDCLACVTVFELRALLQREREVRCSD